MQDIPFFATDNGVASLSLREVPYTGEAYIHIRDTLSPAALLDECVSFCKTAGAEKIYVTGHAIAEEYPLHVSVIRMQCPKENIEDTDAMLFPVQSHTLEQWRKIYNEKMQGVVGSSYMTFLDGKKLLNQAKAYFVHRNGELLGIGLVDDPKIEAVASVVPGAGAEVVSALCSIIYADVISLDVASTNERALRLYQKLGFVPVQEMAKWYFIK